MSFWGRLFGSDKATEKLVDNISSGIDKLWYTDEEKAEDRAQARREGQAVMIQWLANTQGQNLSRRLIALSITFIWLLQYVAGVVLNVATIWVEPTMGAKLSASAASISETAGDVVPAVMLILGFYFAAPHMGSIASVALKRFGQKNDPEKPVKPS